MHRKSNVKIANQHEGKLPVAGCNGLFSFIENRHKKTPAGLAGVSWKIFVKL